MGITTAQLGEPMNFIEVNDGNMGEELLRGTEMSQRQLYHQSPSMPGTAHKSRNLEHIQLVGECSFHVT